jgi:hypothetical protein
LESAPCFAPQKKIIKQNKGRNIAGGKLISRDCIATAFGKYPPNKLAFFCRPHQTGDQDAYSDDYRLLA